jgi:hypothetical protein
VIPELAQSTQVRAAPPTSQSWHVLVQDDQIGKFFKRLGFLAGMRHETRLEEAASALQNQAKWRTRIVHVFPASVRESVPSISITKDPG